MQHLKASGDAAGCFFGSWVPVLSQQQIFKQLFILTNEKVTLSLTENSRHTSALMSC